MIDPERDVDRYFAIAAGEVLKLNAVAETHVHADFASGARALATCSAMRVFLSAAGGPDWQSEWTRDLANVTRLNDADTFKVGSFNLALSAEQVKELDEASQIDPGFPYRLYAKDLVRAIAYGGMRDQILV